MENRTHFDNVSLLITHYNRSASLKRLLWAFEALNCRFGEIVVSDDGSKDLHLHKLKELSSEFGFRLITTPKNAGLGNNINKGQDAVTKAYTLYVQEDFVPKSIFPAHFQNALELMENHPEIDMARFYGYFPYPIREKFQCGFEKIKFKTWYPGYMKFNVYSDHPHLRRSTFFDKFGRYKEGVNGDITEYNMVLSFLKNEGNAIIYQDITALFEQLNNADEPSTATFRKDWRLSRNIFVRTLRQLYLQYKAVKYNKDLLFYPKKNNQ